MNSELNSHEPRRYTGRNAGAPSLGAIASLAAWRKAAKKVIAPSDGAPAFLPVEVAAISSNASPPNCERAEIAFPNGRHLFVAPGLDRRLLEDLIGAVAAAS